MKYLLLVASLFYMAPAFAEYCQEKTPSSWTNCVMGPASDAGALTRLDDLVIDGISLSPTDFAYTLQGSQIVLPAANLILGTLTGNPSVLNGIRYDQEIAPTEGVHVTQKTVLGQVRFSCYRNALNVCMKNFTQDVTLITTLTAGGYTDTKTSSASQPLGERIGFCCQ